MARRFTNPALSGIKSAMFDGDGIGENVATLGRAREEEGQYYRDALSSANPGVESAVTMQQRGGSIMQDPAMKVFLQSMHEKNAAITPRSGFVGSHDAYPLETETRSTFDPSFQTSAVSPSPVLAGLSRSLKGQKGRI